MLAPIRVKPSLIVVGSIVTLAAAASAHAAVTPIQPDQYPPGCHPNGKALQGDGTDNDYRDNALIGTPRRDLLRGGDGGDVIRGRGAADCLFGQAGGEGISGGSGNDWISGGTGPDDLTRGGRGNDRISGGPGFETIVGQQGADRISGDPGQEFISGGSGPDVIDLGPGIGSVAKGRRGDDTLRGDHGPGDGQRDRFYGERGSDRIRAPSGRNLIDCEPGFDTVITNQESNVGVDCEQVTRR
jgi:Ca2+-binding RTX toxin-like protein